MRIQHAMFGIFCAVACSGDRGATTSDTKVHPDTAISRLSNSYQERVGETIGGAISAEARFVGKNRIVFLDVKHSPHLHLFTTQGTHLWSGAIKGGGPRELSQPRAIAVLGDTIHVFQQGRLSRWLRTADTLSFHDAIPVEPTYAPHGAVPGCGGGLLLYAWDRRQFADEFSAGEVVSPVHTFVVNNHKPIIRPWWTRPSTVSAIPYRGHAAVLISKHQNTIALHHRTHPWEAGEVLAMDCSGTVRHTYSERAMVTGEGAPSKVARKRALQWEAGLIAYPGGIAFGVHRYFSRRHHGVAESHWKTEIFFLEEGRYSASTLIQRQWALFDFDAGSGVLMGTNEPIPHFIVLPLHILRSTFE